MAMLRPPAPRRTERGSVLVIALLLLLVIGFLGGVALLIAQTETGIDASLRSASLAFNAAEWGLNLSINLLDIENPAALSTVTLPNLSSVNARSGRRDGSEPVPNRRRNSLCPPGFDPNLGCGLWRFTATGESTRYLVVTARTELESGESIFDGGTTDQRL